MQWAVSSVQCTVFDMQYAVYSVQCTECSIWYAVKKGSSKQFKCKTVNLRFTFQIPTPPLAKKLTD